MISEINNTQVDDAKDIDIAVPMYNLIEYIPIIIQKLWQYCKDMPAVNNNDNIVGFKGANATDSLSSKKR